MNSSSGAPGENGAGRITQQNSPPPRHTSLQQSRQQYQGQSQAGSLQGQQRWLRIEKRRGHKQNRRGKQCHRMAAKGHVDQQQTGNQGYQAYLYRQNVPEAELDSAGLSREPSPQQMTKSRIEALVAENPESLGAKALLAEYYLQVGNLEQAGTIADEILHKQPNHGQGNYLMGKVLQQQLEAPKDEK